MPCHLHGLPESTLPHDSTYDSDFCLECFQQSLETNRGFYQYLDEEDGRVVETDGNTQQSHEQSYWSPSSHEYEDVSEPKNRSDDGDSTEACRASDDTSSADTRAFDTPTSSSDQLGDRSVASRNPSFLPDADAIREDGADTTDTGHIVPDWTQYCLNLGDPWSTFNRRADGTQASIHDFDYDGHGGHAEDNEYDRNLAAAPSQSG